MSAPKTTKRAAKPKAAPKVKNSANKTAGTEPTITATASNLPKPKPLSSSPVEGDRKVGPKELGKHLGLSVSNLSKLVGEGRIVPAPNRGQYWLIASVNLYCEKLRKVAGNDNADYQKAKTVEKNFKARLAGLEFKERSGELILAEDVLNEWGNVLRTVRTAVLGIARKIEAQVSGVNDQQLEQIEQITHDTLHALSDDKDPK